MSTSNNETKPTLAEKKENIQSHKKIELPPEKPEKNDKPFKNDRGLYIDFIEYPLA